MRDIDIPELGLRIAGRAKKLTVGEARELEEHDLLRLAEPRETTAPPIKKLRERHHALARMLASGLAPGEAGIACGYSGSRVSILQGDPAFKELVGHYRAGAAERYFDGHSVMAELHIDAVEELRERLEDDAESFSHGQLMELAKLTADRTGFGPSVKSEVNVKIGLADKLAAGRARVAQMRDVTPDGDA
jgi:hypothetical protein